MRLRQPIIAIHCVVASFIAHEGEQRIAKAQIASNPPTAVELQRLQGTWEGVRVEGVEGARSNEKITITITGSSFHFHRDTNFWFETTIALPAGTEPKQLHATIRNAPPSQTNSIGQVVGAIYKIEDGTLTLVDYAISEEPPTTFADAMARYVVKKVQPARKRAESPTKSRP